MSPKFILLLFGSVVLISCSQNAPVGSYLFQDEWIYRRLDLNADSSFVYTWQGDVGNAITTKGTWKTVQKMLFLKSDDQYLPFYVQESIDEKDRLFLSLKDNEGLSYIRECVRLDKDTNCYETIDDGVVAITPRKNVDTIHIFSVYGFYHYPVRNKNSNVFHIVCDNSNPWYLKDTFWLFNKRKIQTSGGNFLRRMRSEKVKM
jgi:hypothetical protein